MVSKLSGQLGCFKTLLAILAAFQDDMPDTVQFNEFKSQSLLIRRCIKQSCVLASTMLEIFFSTLFRCAMQNKDGTLLHTLSIGKLFDLSLSCTNTMIRRVLSLELLYTDDAVFFYTESKLQLLQTIALSTGTSSSPKIFTNGRVAY